MKKFDKIFAIIINGFIMFIWSFLTGGWLFYYMSEKHIYIGVFGGIFLGIIAEALFLKKLTHGFYNSGGFYLLGIYAAYMVGIFGFFMGVPVFNIIPGIAAGIYAGIKCRLNESGADELNIKLKNFNKVTSAGLLLFCTASAAIALNDPYTANNLKGMLNLKFNVGQDFIWFLIIFGGALILILQNILSVYFGKIAYKN